MSEPVLYNDKIWLKHYEKGVPETIKYEEVFIPQYLDKSADKFPETTALIFEGYKITFRELNTMVDTFVAVLKTYGVKPGDSVSILLPNIIPCVVAYYAILRMGAIAVMNNPLYSDRELEHQFNDSNSTLLVTLDLLADRMVKLRSKTMIKTIIYTSIGDYLPFAKRLLFPLVAKKRKLAADVTPAPDLYKFKEVLESHSPDPSRLPLSLDHVAMYQYTGGTTGVSKGVMLTHGNLSYQVQQLKMWFPTFKLGQATMLGALPFFHVFGLSTSMNFAVSMAWGNILVAKPQAESLLEAITKFKPTFAPLVPTMYIGMLNHPDLASSDLTSIEGCFSGSSPLPLEVINDFQRATGSIIVEGFGLTESSPVTHINPLNGIRKPGSIGLPVSDVECRIVDIDDGVTDKPVGEPGELLVRGPQVMKGYLNKPDETQKTLTREGWLHTGDVATMDDQGYFCIVDRMKDMIISGGFNVYPRDIEEVLYEHPKIQEACCVGIPHPKRGEAAKAFIVLKEGETVTQKEILSFCSTRLAKYKWPVEVEIRGLLPKSTVGKILRKDLKDEEADR
ncbi:MAG: long-chain fatty acid--CoA ligase [Desulfobacterium sp.]|nr:long-chain fatty acid--CoA ligase [Desulfobacterium sp.]